MRTLNTTPRQAVDKSAIKRPKRVTLTELLQALRTGGEISVLAGFNPPRIWTGTPSHLQDELDRDPRRALYYAVNPVERVPARGRGKKQDYTRLAALWVDADYKLTGWTPGEEPEGAQDLLADLRSRLETLLGVPTGFITYSGNGEHWIWLLEPSEQTRHEHKDKDCPLCDGVLNPWHLVVNQEAAKLGLATPDNVHDIARVLRAPGSYNLKQQPGRQTFTLKADRLQYLDIADAKRAITAALVKPASKQATPAPRPQPLPGNRVSRAGFNPIAGANMVSGLLATVAQAREGSRNNSLFWAACRMQQNDLAGTATDWEGLRQSALASGLTEWETSNTILSARRQIGGNHAA